MRPPRVNLITYPKYFFVWPLIVAPAILELLAGAGVHNGDLGWIYALLIGLVILTLGVDLDRNTSFFWGLFVITVLLLVRVITFEWGWSFTDWASAKINSLGIEYSPGFAWAVSIITGIPYAVMIIWTRIQDRWKITPYEFEHFSFGVVDQSLARGAKMIRTSYPDFLEVLLGLSGTLHVYSAAGDKELVRIPHVPLLPLVKGRISRVLEFARMQNQSVAVGEDEAIA